MFIHFGTFFTVKFTRVVLRLTPRGNGIHSFEFKLASVWHGLEIGVKKGSSAQLPPMGLSTNKCNTDRLKKVNS